MELFKEKHAVDFNNDQLLNEDYDFPIRGRFIEDSWMYGSFRTLAKPSSLVHNGSTYSLYYKEKDNLNAVGILKQTDDFLRSSVVNNGTISMEPINHAAPMLHVNKTTNYIYVLQNKLHINVIKVWRSKYPELNNNGEFDGEFEYVGEFGSANTSYLGHLEGDDSDIVLLTRAGQIGVDNYSISIIKVNLDSLVYTQTQVTNVTTGTDMRHYLVTPYQYGTSTWTYFGVATRNQEPTGTGYYKISMFKTLKGGDWEEFFNVEGNVSKDVVATSPIDTVEMEADFTVIGSDSARTTIISEGKLIVLNDDLFIPYMSDDANSRFSIRKLTGGSAIFSDFLIPIETIAESPIWYGPVYMRYNGTNFVYTIAEHDGVGGYVTKIYGSETDFTNWTEFNVDTMANGITPEAAGYFYGMPTNLHEAVASNKKYLNVGRNKDRPQGEFIYAIHTKKWNI